ncbi:alpha/beta hydrolase, partial [Cardiobacterium hominis]|uniref:alpha/beta hydrolase n=1 Tax=Cardiobacterium hominis TaxID=2718 RepID=UPI00248F8AEB
MQTTHHYARWAAIFALLALLFAWTGNRIERDFGRLDVNTITFMTEEMQPMVAKLYRPKTATAAQPAPGLLALHGYQSDKEATNTFGALELARRGYVVLAIDHFGHGYSTKAPAANKNMSGANNGYQYLKSLPFVDNTRLGIFGHSTGALNAIRVAKQNPDHRAVNGQSSNGGEMDGLHNYLLTQGLYEEIGGYREKTYPVKNLVHHEKRLQAFGLPTDSTLEWNHTYGDFADGSARRADLVPGTHLGVMISTATNQSAIDWFGQAMQHDSDVQGFTYWYKEFSGLFALAFALLSALCLAALLLDTP